MIYPRLSVQAPVDGNFYTNKIPPTAALAVRGKSKGEDKYFSFLWYYLKYVPKKEAYTFFFIFFNLIVGSIDL